MCPAAAALAERRREMETAQAEVREASAQRDEALLQVRRTREEGGVFAFACYSVTTLATLHAPLLAVGISQLVFASAILAVLCCCLVDSGDNGWRCVLQVLASSCWTSLLSTSHACYWPAGFQGFCE